MNKSETERQAISDIIDTMPEKEKAQCLSMIRSLLMSLADPVTGQTFMMAVAFANADMAVRLIAAGIVTADGKAIMQNDAVESLAIQKMYALSNGGEDVKH